MGYTEYNIKQFKVGPFEELWRRVFISFVCFIRDWYPILNAV